MPELIEKSKLVAGVPFRLTKPTGDFHFKRNYLGYLQGYPMTEGRLIDDAKDAWEEGNFLLVKWNGAEEPGSYRDFDLYELAIPEVPGIQKAETVYGRLADPRLKPWDEGNFLVIHTETITEEVNGREKTRVVQSLEARDINAWQFYKFVKLDVNGTPTEVVYARVRNRSEAPWAAQNIDFFVPANEEKQTPARWEPGDMNTDFPEQTWKKERVSPKISRKSALDKTKHFAVQFKDDFTYENWKKQTTVGRDFLLATGANLWKIIEEKVKSKVEDGNDPCHYWLTITRTEKPRGETVGDDGKAVKAPPEVTYDLQAQKLSPEEIAAIATAKVAAREAQEEQSTSHDEQTPATQALFGGQASSDDLDSGVF